MKLITRDTDYAVRALCIIAKRKDKITSVDDLVSETKIPRPFLRKILQILNKKGIIKSYKGRNGGFRLLQTPEGIHLMELITIFQGNFALNQCFLRKAMCPDIKKCILKKKIDEIEKYVLEKLELITIKSIMN